MHESLQIIYNRFAETYDQSRNQFDMTDVIHDFFERLPVKTGYLLDLGSGAGEPFPAYFIRHGWRVTGVDFSQKMLDLAHRYTPAMKTVLADICEIQFPDEQFHAITAIYSLFHIEHEKHENLFRNLYRWLKPDGKSLFTYATRDYTGSDIFSGYKEFLGENLFYSHTTPEKLTTLLQTIGFGIEAATYRRIGGETFLWMTISKQG